MRLRALREGGPRIRPIAAPGLTPQLATPPSAARLRGVGAVRRAVSKARRHVQSERALCRFGALFNPHAIDLRYSMPFVANKSWATVFS